MFPTLHTSDRTENGQTHRGESWECLLTSCTSTVCVPHCAKCHFHFTAIADFSLSVDDVNQGILLKWFHLMLLSALYCSSTQDNSTMEPFLNESFIWTGRHVWYQMTSVENTEKEQKQKKEDVNGFLCRFIQVAQISSWWHWAWLTDSGVPHLQLKPLTFSTKTCCSKSISIYPVAASLSQQQKKPLSPFQTDCTNLAQDVAAYSEEHCWVVK